MKYKWWLLGIALGVFGFLFIFGGQKKQGISTESMVKKFVRYKTEFVKLVEQMERQKVCQASLIEGYLISNFIKGDARFRAIQSKMELLGISAIEGSSQYEKDCRLEFYFDAWNPTYEYANGLAFYRKSSPDNLVFDLTKIQNASESRSPAFYELDKDWYLFFKSPYIR